MDERMCVAGTQRHTLLSPKLLKKHDTAFMTIFC